LGPRRPIVGLPGSRPRGPGRVARRHRGRGRRLRLQLTPMGPMHRHFQRAALALLLLVRATSADVLPDDRADLFYSKYSGGGMDITGESVLVRKKFTEDFALEASY